MNYQRIYDQLVEKSRKEQRQKVKGGVKYEAHHVIPLCLGGTGKCIEWRTHPNIILLTPREHIIAHMLLHEIYPNNTKLMYALKMMIETRDNNKVSSRLMSEMREKFSDSMRGERNPNFGKDVSGSNNSAYGKRRHDMIGDNNPMKNPEVKKKVSDALKGKPKPWMRGDKNPMHNKETVRKVVQANEKHKERVIENVRKLLTGKKRPELTGGKHPNAIPVLYQNVRYESQADLARHLGVGCPKIIFMIRKGIVVKLTK